MDAGSALQRLTSLLFCTSLSGCYCQRIGYPPGQAAKAFIDDAHSTIVPDKSSGTLQLDGACGSGLQSNGQRTNDVHFFGSSSPVWSTREIRDDGLCFATEGIFRPGVEVCDCPSLETRRLALVQTCTLSWRALLLTAQGTSGASTSGGQRCLDYDHEGTVSPRRPK